MIQKYICALCALGILAFAGDVQASPCDAPDSAAPPIIQPGTTLSLESVLAEVRRANPAVRAAGLEARASAAETRQARLWLNPTLALEVENFAGEGAQSGFDSAETTLSIEQTFQLGGKRAKAIRAAQAREALASAECGAILRQSELEAAQLYFELLAANKAAKVREETATLAGRIAEAVRKKLSAGAASPPDLARANADAAAARASVSAALAIVQEKRSELALFWGASEPTFILPSGTEQSGPAPLSARQTLTQHPRILSAAARSEAARSAARLESSKAAPDLTVSAGIRRFEDGGDTALVAGVSLPISIFDRNQGNAQAAALRAQASDLQRMSLEAELLAEQRAAVSSFRAARERLTALQSEAIPAAQEAYRASMKGYSAGKFGLITTIDARRVILDARLSEIAAELSLNTEDMRLRSLTGAAPFDGGFYAQN